MTNFESELITLEDVIKRKYFFNIPIYQRLYVWGKEQLHTLLDDIVSAFFDNKNEFYLGGTLVIERGSSLFDLIDGQQRFTTLWLISVVLGEDLEAYRQVQTEQGVRPRISFAIRPQVTEFFKKLCRNEEASLPQAKQLEDALQEIRAYFDNIEHQQNRKVDKTALTNFIRTKVQLILTRVPRNTDLNKLFEAINNRGMQLQHHEILKAKLIKSIATEDRDAYALLWDACADMSGYVEQHLRAITKIKTVTLFEEKCRSDNVEQEQLANASYVLKALQQQRNIEAEAISLSSILTQQTLFTVAENESAEEIDNGLPDRVTSIITFPMLLQHVLRIYLQQNSEFGSKDISKISDKDLLQVFKQHWFEHQPNEAQVKKLFELLWDVRYQFDKHIIKWVLVEEEKQHAIRRMYVNRNAKKKTEYLQRHSADADPDFALLQSMLYHSQQMTTHYWLTPLLKFLLENNEKHAELYLQHLDNHLLCSEANAPLIERTQRYLTNCWHEESVIDANISLNQSFDNGTQYPHYWFYKLEYVLYLKAKSENSKLIDSFRMTAKNSVEHVTPQNPEQKRDEVPSALLHNFGNLALVTRSINSELSNKGFSIKKVEFEHRHKGRGVSLKLESVFENTNWQEPEITAHQKQMIYDFNNYIKSIAEQVTELNR